MSKSAAKKTARKTTAATSALPAGRNAGVLLHITSLPSAFGIGDLGREAFKFVDFLASAGQHYWQVLPVSPSGEEQAWSPYSAVSAMAGNPLLLSPEGLADQGWLSHQEIRRYWVPNTGKVNYKAALNLRETLFEKAFHTFLSQPKDQSVFLDFCEQQAWWLDDFATYMVLREVNDNKPWYSWPAQYKNRNPKALGDINRFHGEKISKVKWLQYAFHLQWKALRNYARDKQVLLFGDLPFYVGYDSADVWSHPEIFKLDAQRNIKGVAGVPPDYFNENGQLWGMPVFRWDVLKRRKYNWWIDRIRRNFELFDLVRLDHFRAFAAYWEVPADETTARNGKWRKGPGADLFHAIADNLGPLAFVAEDLGDIDDAVFALRDQFAFPGMKVLQFAFGDNMPSSEYIPHNYSDNFFVYTGTHDNNTTVGWWLKDSDQKTRANVKLYVDQPGVNQNNIHLFLGRLAYASVARTVILPLQDVLGLDHTARMNLPASTKMNWQWRLKPSQLTLSARNLLLKWVRVYRRGG